MGVLRSSSTGVFAVLLVLLLAGTVVGTLNAQKPDQTEMPVPRYDDEGQLLLPDDFREWVFVGASLGLSYTKTANPDRQLFHHVYIQPQAYRAYAESGAFPEKTMLVMENYSAGSKETAAAVNGEVAFDNLNGSFEQKLVGLEVALKDSENFEDGWAYFNFTGASGLKERAKAFPKMACYNCHNEHAADDNVFVQFYPVLRTHLDARK